VCVLINKADLNSEERARIKEICDERHCQLIGEIPFCQEIIDAMIDKKAVTEMNTPVGQNIRAAWEAIGAKIQNIPRALPSL
jgi:MinD superfamily P-loop ATPase